MASSTDMRGKAATNDLAGVEELLAKGADVNSTNEVRQPMHTHTSGDTHTHTHIHIQEHTHTHIDTHTHTHTRARTLVRWWCFGCVIGV